jgi:DNA-binding transcriptional LysR family regulator
VKLFVRQSGHVSLTNAGRLYHHQIEAALDAITHLIFRTALCLKALSWCCRLSDSAGYRLSCARLLALITCRLTSEP